MKKTSLVTLTLILGILVSVFTVSVPVKAQVSSENHFVDLSSDRVYGLRGENIVLTATSDAPQVQIQIYDPDSLKVYDTTWISNTTQTIPISQTAKYGTYTIKGVAGSSTATTMFTVLDISNWSTVTFPHHVIHKNVEYTFYADWTFTAKLYNDELTVDLSSLRTLANTFNLDVIARKNSMNFLVRFKKDSLGLVVDLDFAFIHSGAKIIVNGTIDQPRNFTFNFSAAKLFRTLNAIRSGNIVFDWGDIVKAKQTFSYDANNKMLTVSVPKTFSVDPAIFSASFESNDYSEFTGTQTTGTATLATSDEQAHHGSYSSKHNITQFNATTLAYKDLGANYETAFARTYFKVTAWNPAAASRWIYILQFYSGTTPSTTYSLLVGLARNSTTDKFLRIWYRNGATGIGEDINANWLLNQWHCIEATKNKASAPNGQITVYLDGSQVWTETGLDTSFYYTRSVGIGNKVGTGAESSATVYFDCVAVNNAYIGLEAAPSIGEFQAPSTVYANQYFHLDARIKSGTADATSLVNATVQMSNNVILQWVNSTNTFSENSDPNGYCTLDAGSSTRTTVNSTSYKLSWYMKLNNYSSGSINVVATNTKVFDNGGWSGSGSKTGLFTFSYISLTLQARDSDGTNLPRQVTFKGTLGNGTSFDVNSDTSGAYTFTATCYGSHTINVWWGTHLTGTKTQSITADATVNIDTKVSQLDSGSNYLLFSLNNTDLPTPELVNVYDWRMIDVVGTGSIQFKMDNANWIKTNEPYSFSVAGETYTTGTGTWSFAANIFTFTIPFSTKSISMTWVAPSSSGPTGPSVGPSVTLPPLPEPIAPIVPLPPPELVPTISALPPIGSVGIVAIIIAVFGTIGYSELKGTKQTPRRVWRSKRAKKPLSVRWPRVKPQSTRWPKGKPKSVKWRKPKSKKTKWKKPNLWD